MVLRQLQDQLARVLDHSRWYVDDILYSTQNSWSTTAADFPAPFDERFYILFNVAVGGNFPGAPIFAMSTLRTGDGRYTPERSSLRKSGTG